MARRPENMACRMAGFTLTEMLVALAILLFGLTALAASMTVGVSTRRGTEMQLRAVDMVDQIFHELEEDYLPRFGPEDPAQPASVEDVPGYPGMKYTAEFTEDPEHPEVVLVKIDISWREQGEAVAESFERILIRHVPFSRRISDLREQR